MDLNTLVRRIIMRPSDFELVRERVRHWARNELLVTGAFRVGRGRSRNFAPSCVVEAALLNELTDSGIGVVAWAMTDALLAARIAAEDWAGGDHRPRWLQLIFTTPPTRQRSGRMTVLPHVERLELVWPPGEATTIVIDVAAILTHLKWGPDDEDADRRMKQ
jgi:hypothetical protein